MFNKTANMADSLARRVRAFRTGDLGKVVSVSLWLQENWNKDGQRAVLRYL